MALTAGTRIRSYEVTAQIGAGGMGEVYQATDTSLARQVAIKVLPEAVGADPERLARFGREARTLASLNHPNIAHIYGLEKSGSITALVMELVEGPTVADRVAVRPIPFDEALPIAKQIAEALEAAHEQGIVHRDLKPANIKVRPDGTVKVLDFGLAKAMEPARAASSSLSMSPTITTPAMTEAGLILGTAAYMSPEQARGKPVDKRTDIWAFGCVLYEMLTGVRPFQGEDVSLTLAAVMRGEPDWNRLPVLPPALTVFLKRCLQKDPRQRVADIHDVRLALDGAFDVPVSTANPSSPNDGRRHRSLPWSIGVAVLTGMSGLLGWMLRPDTAPPVPVSREVISAAPSPPVALTGGTFVDVAISPDGQNVVYQSSVAPAQVVVRALDALEGIPLRGPESVLSPVVSPDGEWVAFQTGDGTLARAPIQGGPPMTICPLPASLRGASWGRDGTIVFGLSQPGGLWRVPAAGGVPEPLTTADNGETDAYPDLLPNGAGVVFTIGRTNGSTLSDTRIAVADLRTGEQRVIIETGTSPRYTSDHIVYAVGNSLLAVPFDPERLEVTGDPVPMMDGVLTKSGGATSFALSETGSLVYVTTGEGGGDLRTAVWVDRTGHEESLPLPPRAYQNPRVSPDGTRVAVGVPDANGDLALWVYSVNTGAGLRLTQQGGTNTPVWVSNDRIAFWSNAQGASGQIDTVEADGSGHPEQLLVSPSGIFGDFPTSFDVARHDLIFTRLLTAAHREIFRLPLQQGAEADPVLQGAFNRGNAELSPDGRWLVYRSDQSGAMEVYLQGYPGPGPTVPVSIGGGASVTWFPDGKALGYRLADQMMSVSVETGTGAPRIGRPTELFRGSYFASPNGSRQYHIAPDGRFLMLKSSPGSTAGALPPQVVLVQNWLQELNARVPTR